MMKRESSNSAESYAIEDPVQIPATSNGLMIPQPPYDAWVLAGGRLFRAHSHILGAHSPYLRASMGALGESRLLLPHIPAGGFSAVLAYMYTGRLSLSHAPVYEILLTGHLLQMPTVVGLCQVLLSTTPSPVLNTSLIQSPYQPSTRTSPSLGVGDLLVGNGGIPGTELPPALNAWRSLARLVPSSTLLPPDYPQQSTSSTGTLVRPTPTRPSVPSIPSTVDKPKTADIENEEKSPTPALSKQSLLNVFNAKKYVFCQFNRKGDPNSPLLTSKNGTKGILETSRGSRGGSVVVDIAACDGPVFFERVVNKSFRCNSDEENLTDSDDESVEIDVVENEPTMRAPEPTTYDLVANESSKIEQTEDTLVKKDFVQGQLASSSTRYYHCVYCNNNFKSHYCYQKHMRRHINPISIEENATVENRSEKIEDHQNQEPLNLTGISVAAPPTPSSSTNISEFNVIKTSENLLKTPSVSKPCSRTCSPSTSISTTTTTPPGTKLRTLDLNVQYFPCKSCGSKFPSYYFVHKHRRLCHADEEDMDRATNKDSNDGSCDSSAVSKLGNVDEPKLKKKKQ